MDRLHGRGDPLPPRGAHTHYRIVYPTPGHPLELLVVNPTWDGFDTHWLKRDDGGKSRTIICNLPGECWCQMTPMANKWHGYIGCVEMRLGKRVILSCTQRSMLTLLDVEPERTSLRGLMIVISRATLHPNSIATAEKSPKAWNTPLPAEMDLLPTLSALYGADQIQSWHDRVRGKDGAK